MIKINAYLTFNGNCEEAFIFYKSVFGGDFLYLGRFKDVPPSDKALFRPESEAKIMHATFQIGEHTVLQGSDIADENLVIFGKNITLSINMDNKEEADRIFKELSLGGDAFMAMQDTFWGSYFGAFTDKFGIQWMINCDTKTFISNEFATH